MKFRIRKNQWDNWYGYNGWYCVIAFSNTPSETMEQQAERWMRERSLGWSPWPNEKKVRTK